MTTFEEISVAFNVCRRNCVQRVVEDLPVAQWAAQRTAGSERLEPERLTACDGLECCFRSRVETELSKCPSSGARMLRMVR